MEPAPDSFPQLAANAKEVARRVLTIGANRLELLQMEVQEQRTLLLHAIVLAFGAAAIGLLGGITLTGLLVFLFYDKAPCTVMLTLTILYGTAAVMIHGRLNRVLRSWRNLPATFEQLRKDRVCLETIFE